MVSVEVFYPIAVVAAVYMFIAVLISFYNFWRAPPPAGHRLWLMVSIVLFGLGASVDGGSKLGFISESVGDVGDLFLLVAMIVFLYVSRSILGQIRGRTA